MSNGSYDAWKEDLGWEQKCYPEQVLCVWHAGMGWVTADNKRIFKTTAKLKAWLKKEGKVGINPTGDRI